MAFANHVVAVMETKELNDEQVAYRYRCCDEAMTDAWVTVHVTLAEADQDNAVQTHIANMKARHEAKQVWRRKQANAQTNVLPNAPDATVAVVADPAPVAVADPAPVPATTDVTAPVADSNATVVQSS